MKLDKHIQANHKGNNSAYARELGVSQHQVQRWLKRNCIVVGGVVYCEVSRVKNNQVENCGEWWVKVV